MSDFGFICRCGVCIGCGGLGRRKLIALLLVILIPVAVAAPLIVSNIFRGTITKVSLPENLVINDVQVPETVTVGTPFRMYINVTNPNDFTVSVRLYINFTLVGATQVTPDSISYLVENNFTYVPSGCNPSSYDFLFYSDGTIRFRTPSDNDSNYIAIPSGTHVYYIVFQLNTQCTSLEYAVWFQNE